MQTRSPTLSTNMLQRIICISVFSIFCLFGPTHLPTADAAPFEYNEDHEQYPYDLETQQSQAKYDTRLLSQQLLKEQKASESSHERHVKHNENDDENEEKTETMDYNVDDIGDGFGDGNGDGDGDGEDLQPHERAASCYTHGHKYTHGQKVPRSDPCEVCLCMDGEIFCWWEKCEKRKFERLASTTEKSRPKNHKKIKKHKSAMKQQLRLTTSTANNDKRKNYNKNKNADDELTKAEKIGAGKGMVQKSKHINQQSAKTSSKKFYYELSKQNVYKQKQQKQAFKQQQQQQQQHQQQQQKEKEQKQQKQQAKHSNYQHSSSSSFSSSASSKILNFPENLPSVLYYDYHTEEHEHHQHQHHQQHLKHQLQKKLQSQREHQKQEQQEQQRQHQHQQKHTKHSASALQLTTSPLATYPSKNGVNENAPSSAYDDETLTDSDILPEPPTKKPKMTPAGQTTASTAFTTINGVTSWHSITTPDIVGHQESNFNNNAHADDNDDDDNDNVAAAAAAALGKQQWSPTVLAKIDNDAQHSYIGETLATSTIIARDDVVEINKMSQQQSQRTLNDKADTSRVNKDLQSNENVKDKHNGNNDDNNDVEGDDADAFHRWLTSTESYNKYKSDNNTGTKSYASNNNDDVNNDVEDYDATLTNENSDLENPFGIQNLTINSQRNAQNKKNNNGNSNSSKGKNVGNKVFYPKDQQQSIQNAENGFLHNVDNGGGGSSNSEAGYGDGIGVGNGVAADSAADDVDYNGGVVNIDILLTTPDELQQQQQQQQQHNKQTTSTKTVQLPRAPTSIKFAADLISQANSNGMSGGSSSSSPSAKAFNDTKMKTSEMGELSPEGRFDKENLAVTQTDATMAAAASATATPTKLLPAIKTLAEKAAPLSVQFIKQSNMSVKDAVNRTAFNDDSGPSTVGTTTATITTSTELSTTITRQCNVMGTLYKIGDVLPQDTGNCLQCICIDGSTIDDTPRVTCSPHNCPPLVLPDLFDATGY